jgi:uncharacterized protein (DUF1330 family)
MRGTVPAYVIYESVVTDPERYERYKSRAAATIEAAGGRYIVRGGDMEVLEGESPAGRVVVLEFPTMQMALDWYRGADYAEVKKLREGAAQARMYVTVGLA